MKILFAIVDINTCPLCQPGSKNLCPLIKVEMFVVTEGEDAKSEEALEDVHRYSDKTILEDCSLIYHVRARGGPGGC